MRCPNCGAEIGTSNTCEYCGSTITSEMKKEQEILNKSGCPKCGSTNIKFSRENHGEVNGKNSKKIVHKTVGVCNDCGYTWYLDVVEPKKRKTWLWVLGWIFIFPVPLTILMLRKKDMKPAVKYGIIAAAWVLYLIIGFGRNSSNNRPSTDNTAIVAEQSKETEKEEQAKPGIILRRMNQKRLKTQKMQRILKMPITMGKILQKMLITVKKRLIQMKLMRRKECLILRMSAMRLSSQLRPTATI